MNKKKAFYLFFLGLLFGVSSSLLAGSMFVEKVFMSDSGPTVEISSNSLISSIRDTLKSISIGTVSEKYQNFENVQNILDTHYYDYESIDEEKMLDNALKGYVDAIGDPYTVYFTTQENTDFKEELKGEKDFEGIGAVVMKKEDGVLIEEVLKGFPAYQAGLKHLDLILEIDGTKTLDLTVNEAVALIRGPKGSTVTLTIYRESENKIMDVDVIRDKIVVPSVMGKTYQLTGDINVGYIEISIIGEDTADALNDVITEIKKENIEGVILDLRGNGGGLLNIAAEVSSHFVPEDELIVAAKYRVYPDDEYYSYGYKTLEGLPVVILVDGLTASASEIISAALKDNIGAKLVGTKTFGKGSIQTIHDLNGSSAIKFTIGKWYTPKDINIDKEGLEPDFEIKYDIEKFEQDQIDVQLEKAKEVLLESIK